MQTAGWTVAVSYLEWIRWVATGWFRCADRVVWLGGLQDQAGMDSLMDRAPDLQVSDDQGYVVALLRPDFFGNSKRSATASALGHLLLPLGSVQGFIPLSSRGARLIEADAERAAVHLREPMFEPLWASWRDRRIEEEANRRGLSLCVALGLEEPELTRIDPGVLDILAGRTAAPNAAKAGGAALEGTRAFGWAAALSVVLMEERVRSVAEGSVKFAEAKAALKALKADFDVRRSLLEDEIMRPLGAAIDQIVSGAGEEALPVHVQAVVIHYSNLAAGGGQLSLHAMLEDLSTVAMQDPGNASLCAYCIGRSMENVAVTTLLYQSDPDCYRALSPARPSHELNVMRRAAERYERATPKAAPNLPTTPEPAASSSQRTDEKEAPSSASSQPSELTVSANSVDASLQTVASKPEESVEAMAPAESEVHKLPSSGAAELEEARAAPGLLQEDHSASHSVMTEHPPAPVAVESPGDSVQELPSTDLFGGDQGSRAAAVQPELKGSGKKRPRGDSRPKS
jgi:hypothetical protein